MRQDNNILHTLKGTKGQRHIHERRNISILHHYGVYLLVFFRGRKLRRCGKKSSDESDSVEDSAAIFVRSDRGVKFGGPMTSGLGFPLLGGDEVAESAEA